jgi:FkbM family methyltransferase
VPLLARALRPAVARAYAFKRRYRIGDRFLARHPRLADRLMTLLSPFKTRSVVDVHGHVLQVDPSDYLGLTINRVYEPEVTRFLQESVRSGQTAIDLGANIGYFTLLLAQLVGPEGRVFAFEPDPANFELLERNVGANNYTNVTCFRKAVADRSGRTLLYRSASNPGDHKLVDDGSREAVEVEVVALDDALPELRGSVHWIKMDIQGAELAALGGMRALLDSAPELTVVTELSELTLAEFGASVAELVSLMSRFGFGVNQILADGTLQAVSPEDRSRITAKDGAYLNVAFTRT